MKKITITHTILSWKEIQNLPDGTIIRFLGTSKKPIDGKGNLKNVSCRVVKLADGIANPEYNYDEINKCYNNIHTWEMCERIYAKDALFVYTQIDGNE